MSYSIIECGNPSGNFMMMVGNTNPQLCIEENLWLWMIDPSISPNRSWQKNLFNKVSKSDIIMLGIRLLIMFGRLTM